MDLKFNKIEGEKAIYDVIISDLQSISNIKIPVKIHNSGDDAAIKMAVEKAINEPEIPVEVEEEEAPAEVEEKEIEVEENKE